MRLRGLDRRAAVGLVVVLAIAAIWLIGFAQVLPQWFAPDSRSVEAVFRDTAQLKSGDAVRIDGVKAGTVERISLQADGTATVRMRVDDEAGPVYRDAAAAIRWRTLLGGVFSVDLDRGHPGAGDLGSATIAPPRTSSQVQIEDVTTMFGGSARRGLRTIPRELARSLRREEDPARLLDTVAAQASRLTRGLRASRGSQPSRDLRRLVRASARTVRSLDTPADDAARFVDGAASVLGRTGRRASDLRRAVELSPGTLTETGATLRRLDHTLGLADRLVAALEPVPAELTPTARALRPTVLDAHGLLRDARPLVGNLQRAARPLAAAAAAGAPLIADITPSLKRVDTTILPFMAERDAGTGHPAYEMVGPALSVLGSGGMGQLDAVGHFFRFPATFSEASVNASPCRTYLSNPDEPALVKCNDLVKTLQTYLSYRPLTPIPGTDPGGGG